MINIYAPNNRTSQLHEANHNEIEGRNKQFKNNSYRELNYPLLIMIRTRQKISKEI